VQSILPQVIYLLKQAIDQGFGNLANQSGQQVDPWDREATKELGRILVKFLTKLATRVRTKNQTTGGGYTAQQ